MEKEEIKKTISNLIKELGFENFEIDIKEKNEDEPTIFLIQIPEANILIGEHGQNLRALEQISKLLVNKALNKYPKFIIDINNYRKERENYLKDLARSLAQKVVTEKNAFKLPPMSAFERRIIHAELATRPDVITESQGEGQERKVVIKPYL